MKVLIDPIVMLLTKIHLTLLSSELCGTFFHKIHEQLDIFQQYTLSCTELQSSCICTINIKLQPE